MVRGVPGLRGAYWVPEKWGEATEKSCPPPQAPGSKYRFENNFRLHPKTPSKGSCAPVKCSNLLTAALLG